MQQPQLLRPQLGDEKIDTGRIAAWSTETRGKTKLDRVFGDAEDDGDRRGCRFGRQRRRDAAGRGDHGDLPANQFGRQRRQSIDFTLGPAVFNRRVHALDIAGLFQAPVICGRKRRVGVPYRTSFKALMLI